MLRQSGTENVVVGLGPTGKVVVDFFVASWSCFSEDCVSPAGVEPDVVDAEGVLDNELRSTAVLVVVVTDDMDELEEDCGDDCCCA